MVRLYLLKIFSGPITVNAPFQAFTKGGILNTSARSLGNVHEIKRLDLVAHVTKVAGGFTAPR